MTSESKPVLFSIRTLLIEFFTPVSLHSFIFSFSLSARVRLNKIVCKDPYWLSFFFLEFLFFDLLNVCAAFKQLLPLGRGGRELGMEIGRSFHTGGGEEGRFLTSHGYATLGKTESETHTKN